VCPALTALRLLPRRSGGGGANNNLGEVLARLAQPGGAAHPLDDFLYCRPDQNRLAAENAAARCVACAFARPLALLRAFARFRARPAHA
jgi:hypothetical protein